MVEHPFRSSREELHPEDAFFAIGVTLAALVTVVIGLVVCVSVRKRHKTKNEQLNQPVENKTYGLFAHLRASFGAFRRSTQILELDKNYIGEQQGHGEKEDSAYSTVDIVSTCKHISVNDNKNPSLSGPDTLSGNTKHDGYDHLGQHCIKQHNTRHIYDTFRNTRVYDTTANIFKQERTDNVYDSLQSKKEVQ